MSFRLPLRLLKLPSKRELAWQFLLSKAGARMRRLINLAIKISPTECLITTLNRKPAERNTWFAVRVRSMRQAWESLVRLRSVSDDVLAIIRRIDDSVYVQEKKGS